VPGYRLDRPLHAEDSDTDRVDIEQYQGTGNKRDDAGQGARPVAKDAGDPEEQGRRNREDDQQSSKDRKGIASARPEQHCEDKCQPSYRQKCRG
jgi:hypothetical protein